MKKFTCLLLSSILIANTYAQVISQKNVPAVVLNAFQVKFPNIMDAEWKLENGNFMVGFEVNDKENELLMSDRGIILQHLQDLYLSEIPKSILETITSKIAFFDVNDADRLLEGSKISYKIILKISEKKHQFLTDEKGKLLKYTKEIKAGEIPLQITKLINTKYGTIGIDDASYTEENGRITYLINGEINDQEHIFLIDDKAILLEHYQDLSNLKVPVLVRNTVRTAYPGFEIRDADLIEKAGEVSYMLKLRKSKDNISLIINPDGKILEEKK